MVIEKRNLIIPKGIEYLSDWKDFRFNIFDQKCILDKVVPGCGFTEYCITGPENVVLCSPRKVLLENKFGKHSEEVYLVKNELEVVLNFDKNISDKPDKSAINTVIQNPLKEDTERVYKRIYEEIENYKIKRDNAGLKPYKILVTYDSFHIVKDILEHLGIFKSFVIVIDEFQVILTDSKFKSSTEIKFLEHLQQSHSSIFVSATPMMEKYLNEIDEFNGLSYYKFDWITEDSARIIHPDLKIRSMNSVGSKCKDIVKKYLDGKFKSVKIRESDGEIKEIISREAVFYVNSVNHIINVIKSCNLKPEEVNIICSDTDYNRKRLKNRLGKEYLIGTVPEEHEPNKMFTFCTRTVYVGADFYSKCAQTFIFSDANINTLAVDISEDLTQILGRQRDNDNPWANSATFFYIPSRKNKKEDFEKNLETKLKITWDLLGAYDEVGNDKKLALSNTYELMAKAFNYRDNYVAVNSNNIPVLNKLALIAEKRMYEIQEIDYADRVMIYNKLEETFGKTFSQNINEELLELGDKYDLLKTDRERLKLLCSISTDLMYQFINTYLPDHDKIKSIMLILDQKRLKALGYDIARINKEIKTLEDMQNILPDILMEFKEGDHYSNVYLSEKLQFIYNRRGLGLKAKATDIKKWFEIKSLLFNDKNLNKRVKGIKLLRKL